MNTTLDELIDALEEAAQYYGMTKVSNNYDSRDSVEAKYELDVARIALKAHISNALEQRR